MKKERRILHKIVPQSDIDRLEEARKELFRIIPEQFHPSLIMSITPVMYEITHRKYAIMYEEVA